MSSTTMTLDQRLNRSVSMKSGSANSNGPSGGNEGGEDGDLAAQVTGLATRCLVERSSASE